MKNNFFIYSVLYLIIFVSTLFSNDLDEIKKREELRHIGFLMQISSLA